MSTINSDRKKSSKQLTNSTCVSPRFALFAWTETPVAGSQGIYIYTKMFILIGTYNTSPGPVLGTQSFQPHRYPVDCGTQSF